MPTKKNVRVAHDQLLFLTELTTNFSNVHRIILYPDGHYENDAEHSFHLALCATEIAATYHPELDVGLVSQYCIVHDLPEVYAGDVPSWKMTKEKRARKIAAEKDATKRLLKELPPHTAKLLESYEQQKVPEARFVRLIDKVLPAALHAVVVGANKRDFFTRFNITRIEDLDEGNQRFYEDLVVAFPEFDFALLLREVIAQTSRDRFLKYPEKS